MLETCGVKFEILRHTINLIFDNILQEPVTRIEGLKCKCFRKYNRNTIFVKHVILYVKISVRNSLQLCVQQLTIFIYSSSIKEV